MSLAAEHRFHPPDPDVIAPADGITPPSRPPSMPYRSRPYPARGPRNSSQIRAKRALQALSQRHRQLQQREIALQKAANNFSARANDASAQQRRRELVLAAERYRGQRQLLEAEWRLKRQERQLQAERNSRRRLELERQIAIDRRNRENLLRMKLERERAAQRLKQERMAAQAEKKAAVRMEERQLRNETNLLVAQRMREQQMRLSERMIQRSFGNEIAGERLRSLAGRLSLFAAQSKLSVREAFNRMLRERLHVDMIRSETDMLAFESELNAWAVQRGYEADRFADSQYLYPLLDNCYSDPYWTDYYHRYGCFYPDYDWTASSYDGYGNEVYWDDPLLSGDPLSFSHHNQPHYYGGGYGFDTFDAYPIAYGMDYHDESSRSFSRGYDNPYDGYESYGYDVMDAIEYGGANDMFALSDSPWDYDYGYDSSPLGLEYDMLGNYSFYGSDTGDFGGYLEDAYYIYDTDAFDSFGGTFDTTGYGGYETNQIGYY